LNSVLIPLYGFIGAATTSILVQSVLAAFLLPKSLCVMPIRLPQGAILRWGGFSALLAIALWTYAPFLQGEVATIFGLVSITTLMGVLGGIFGLHHAFLVKPHRS
ncbi:MAG: hypothetical protein PHU04_00510, partial [Candidatus Peribacteraceae bacterium]|nr:hypothetical protein [Candidatus Peribacteraceae bacterium]